MIELFYTLSIPIVSVGESIVEVLNTCDNTRAELETSGPKEVSIKVTLEGTPTPKDIFEVGVLVGTLEKY